LGGWTIQQQFYLTSNYLEWKLEAVLNLQDKSIVFYLKRLHLVKCNDMLCFTLKCYSKDHKRDKSFTANTTLLLWEGYGSEFILNGTWDVRRVNFSDYEVTKVRRLKKTASNNKHLQHTSNNIHRQYTSNNIFLYNFKLRISKLY
jgi:hypothetical protein